MNIKDYIKWLTTLPDTTFVEMSTFTNDMHPNIKQVNSCFTYTDVETHQRIVASCKEEPHLVDEILSGKVEAFKEA